MDILSIIPLYIMRAELDLQIVIRHQNSLKRTLGDENVRQGATNA